MKTVIYTDQAQINSAIEDAVEMDKGHMPGGAPCTDYRRRDMLIRVVEGEDGDYAIVTFGFFSPEEAD